MGAFGLQALEFCFYASFCSVIMQGSADRSGV
jgi:hypothetical protein